MFPQYWFFTLAPKVRKLYKIEKFEIDKQYKESQTHIQRINYIITPAQSFGTISQHIHINISDNQKFSRQQLKESQPVPPKTPIAHIVSKRFCSDQGDLLNDVKGKWYIQGKWLFLGNKTSLKIHSYLIYSLVMI